MSDWPDDDDPSKTGGCTCQHALDDHRPDPNGPETDEHGNVVAELPPEDLPCQATDDNGSPCSCQGFDSQWDADFGSAVARD